MMLTTIFMTMTMVRVILFAIDEFKDYFNEKKIEKEAISKRLKVSEKQNCFSALPPITLSLEEKSENKYDTPSHP